jgi:hypothetical protein
LARVLSYPRNAALWLALTLAMPAGAMAEEDNRYGSWAPPGNGGNTTAQMVKELRRLVDEAEKARAADPRFLYDLRALARRYENPWARRIVADDFADGNHTRNPAWTIASGDFQVGRAGLRTRVEAATAAPSTDERREATPEELAAEMLGRLLSRGQAHRSDTRETPAPRRPAEIYLSRTVSNAFALSVMISGRGEAGGTEFALYQGAGRDVGYRLSFAPGQGLSLIRAGRGGGAIIEQSGSATALSLNDGAEHALRWTRDSAGFMIVSLDDERLFEVVDHGFRDPFDGISWITRGGEYTLRRLVVDGAD